MCTTFLTEFSKFETGIKKSKEIENNFNGVYKKLELCFKPLKGRTSLFHGQQVPAVFTFNYQGSLRDGCCAARNFAKLQDFDGIQIEMDRIHVVGEIPLKDSNHVKEIIGTSHVTVLHSQNARKYFTYHYRHCYDNGQHGEFLNSENAQNEVYERTRLKEHHLNFIQNLFALASEDVNLKIDVVKGDTRDPSANITHKICLGIKSTSILWTLFFDNVSSLQLSFWPKSAEKWLKSGKWPDEKERNRIVHEQKCGLVPIKSNNTSGPYEWRYSFSDIECHIMGLLFQAKNQCYLIYFLFKALFYRFLKSKHDSEKDRIPSYMVKTTFLLLSEDYPPEDDCWKEPKDGLVKLLEKLKDYLFKKHLPHYFLRHVNILQPILDFDEKLCSALAKEIDDILTNPDTHLDSIFCDFDEIIEHNLKLISQLSNFLHPFLDTLIFQTLQNGNLNFLKDDDSSLFEKYNDVAKSQGKPPLDSKFSEVFANFCKNLLEELDWGFSP